MSTYSVEDSPYLMGAAREDKTCRKYLGRMQQATTMDEFDIASHRYLMHFTLMLEQIRKHVKYDKHLDNSEHNAESLWESNTS